MVMANLFTDDMMHVWNSEVYRVTRRLVAGQGAASAAEQYCYGCKKVCPMEPREDHVAHREAPVLAGA